MVQFNAAALIHAKAPAVLSIAFTSLVHMSAQERVIKKEEGQLC